MNGATLVVISPLKGLVLPNGNIVLTEKFVDGMGLYRRLWGGPILHICEPAEQESDNLDNVQVEMSTPDFNTICTVLSDNFLRSVLTNRSLVLTSVGEQFNSVSSVCKDLGIPCVYITEYTLRTRIQIITEYQTGVLRGAWQKFRQFQQEVAQRRAISISAGVQCNGLPTFRAYHKLSANSHLFFDTRTETSMLATPDQISNRYSSLRLGRKLRLTFSGRLTLMKGVDDLLKVADFLREPLGDRFEMSICGDGDYAETLRRDIAKSGLISLVKMHGNLDFKTELLPLLTNETDIFVCCHRQGDPSCTYLETMACGVPIIGYANEAWSRLSKFSQAGWVVERSAPERMAEKIVELNRTPETVEEEAIKSLYFARNHTFEKTFSRRIEHLKSIMSVHATGTRADPIR